MPQTSLRQRKTTGRVVHEFKHGELKSGRGGKGGKVKSLITEIGVKNCSSVLGHRNIQNTTRYTALAPERFKEFFRDWSTRTKTHKRRAPDGALLFPDQALLRFGGIASVAIQGALTIFSPLSWMTFASMRPGWSVGPWISIVRRFARPAVIMLFAFSGITSPAEMLGVIVGLVILAAVAFSEARRKAILRSHYRASI